MKKPLSWIPLWIDPWLFGSTRIELSLEQRSVWVDLLTLAGKDSGFIRANEGVPYPPEQMAGMLRVPLDVLVKTIDRCLETGKLKQLPDDTLYVASWESYSLTPQYRRRLKNPPPSSPHNHNPKIREEKKSREEREKSKGRPQKRNTVSQKRNTRKKIPLSSEEIEKEFAAFWDSYPEDRGDRDQAFDTYQKLRATQPLETIEKAFAGYCEFLKHKRIKENFEQAPMYASKFLRDGWKRFTDFKYEPPL
jgi:hypothetical protein